MSDMIDLGPKRRMCKHGIMEDYLKYASHQESPQDFHLWTCIGLLGIAMGRRCYLDFSYGTTFPNLYIILVGESAITHKSTALSMGVSRTLNPVLAGRTHELSDPGSPQALVGELALLSEETGKCEAFIHASELSVMLGQQKLDDSLLKLLTHLWDSPDHHSYVTRGRGKEVLKEVCISMLGGSTPVWLRNSVPPEALEGGFFSRLILVNRPPTGQKNALPLLTTSEREAHERVKNDLEYIRVNLKGEFSMSRPAKELYINWYEDINKPERAQSFMRGYYGRKGDFVLKLAMIRSVDLHDKMIITDDDVLWALDVLQRNEMFTKDIVKYMGTTEAGSNYNKVRAKIKSSIVTVKKGGKMQEIRGIRHSDLARNLSYTLRGEQIREIVDHLLEAEEIRIVSQHGARAKIYEWLGEQGDTSGLGNA